MLQPDARVGTTRKSNAASIDQGTMQNAELKSAVPVQTSPKQGFVQEYSNETVEALTFLQGHIVEEQYAGSLAQLHGRPIILLVVFATVAHYVFVTWKKVPVSSYGLSYKTAFKNGALWRIFTSMVGHDDVLHLLFDLFVLWSASALELRIGSLQVLRYLVLLVLMNALVFYLIYDLLVRRCELGAYFGNHFTVGFTSVVVGQIIILSHYQKLFDIPLFPGVLLPLAPAPLVLVFLASMIVSRSKFFQHSFGALVGLVLVSGYLDWVSNYWLFVIMSWVCFFVLLSIKKTTSRPLPWLEVYEWPFEDEDSENDNSRLNDEADAEQEPLDEVPVAERPVIQVIDVTAPVNPSSSTSTSILNWRRFRGNSRRNGSVLPV